MADIIDRMGIKYTKMETKILTLLSDGRAHSKKEISEACGDAWMSSDAIAQHIASLREKLKHKNEWIACEMRFNRGFYRHVLLLPSSRNGHVE